MLFDCIEQSPFGGLYVNCVTDWRDIIFCSQSLSSTAVLAKGFSPKVNYFMLDDFYNCHCECDVVDI